MSKIRYNDFLTMAQYFIASREEVDIEAMAWDCREKAESRDSEAAREALREIDRLKLAGEYEAERARLAKYLDPPSPAVKHLAQRARSGEFGPFQNFLDGLSSPDPDHRGDRYRGCAHR